MNSKIKKAHAELSAAHREGIEAMMTITSIQTFNVVECACRADGPCAYHADLINRMLETLKRMSRVLDELGRDLADPMRAH
jgi:hypothetical protein